MGNKKIEKIIALFVIALVVLFPSSSVVIYASEGDIQKFVIKGNTNSIEGMVAENERIKYEVTIGSNVLDPNNNLHLRLGFSSSQPFSSCSPQEGLKICTAYFPENAGTIVDLDGPGGDENLDLHSITVRLFNTPDEMTNSWNSVTPIDDATATYIIENTKPRFTNAPKIENKNVITFAAEDPICTTSTCGGICAGLKNVKFYKGSVSDANLLGEFPTENRCSISNGQFTIPNEIAGAPAFSVQGENPIVIRLEDRLGHAVAPDYVVKYNYDTQAPAVTSNSFKIFKEPFGEIKKIGSANKIIANLKVEVEFDADIDTATIFGQFSSLNPALTSDMAPSECKTPTGNKIKCEWRGLALKLFASPLEISVKGKDKNENVIEDAPNSGSKKLSLTLEPDSSLKVISISVNDQTFAAGQKQYARSSGNKINVTFEEETGLLKEEVFLLNSPAGDCRQLNKISEPIKWNCVWDNIGLSGLANNMLTLDSATTDILGNPISQNQQVEVVIDNDAPVVNPDTDIVIKAASTTDNPIEGVYKIDDRLNVNVYVKDSNPVKAEADFSPFSTQGSKINCVDATEADRQGYKICSWTAVPMTGGGTGELKFRITDAAGNPTSPQTIFKQLTVSGVKDGDYWRMNPNPAKGRPIECSPKNNEGLPSINRKLGALKEQNVYCAVELVPNEGLSFNVMNSLRIVDVRITGCTNTQLAAPSADVPAPQATSTTLLKNPIIYRKSIGTTIPSLNPVPVIQYTFNKGQYNVDEINSECTLEIFSQSSEGVTQIPETEKIDVKFKLFDLPNAAETLKQKTDKERKELKKDKVGKNIERLRKLAEYALKICTFFQTYYKVLSIMEQVVMILDNVQTTAAATVVGAPAAAQAGATKSAVCGGEQAGQEAGAKAMGPGAKQGFKAGSKLANTKKTLGKFSQGGLGKFCNYLRCDYVPWNRDILDSLDEWYGVSHIASANIPQGEKQVSLAEKMNIEDSIISSIMFGCLPGIIKNLNEYRQIKCAYVACLEKDVPFGQDPRTCDRVRNRLYCKYVVGEVFSILPYYQFLNSFQDTVRQILTNPFALGAFVAGNVCATQCTSEVGSGWRYYACVVPKWLIQSASIGDAFKQAATAANALKNLDISDDQCKALKL